MRKNAQLEAKIARMKDYYQTTSAMTAIALAWANRDISPKQAERLTAYVKRDGGDHG